MSALTAVLAHPDVARLTRALGTRRPTPADAVELGVLRAGVAVVLRQTPDEALELLMIKRAEYEGDPWSGHVALPGGRHEPGDASLEDTAVRETWEETGVDIRRDGRVLGVLDDVRPRTPRLPPLVIRPYVAVVVPDVEIVPSDEVAAAFWVPLAALLQPAAWCESVVHVGSGERIVVPSFCHGDYVVWGLTERVLRQLVRCLAPGE